MALVHRNPQSDTHLYDVHFGGDQMAAAAIDGFTQTPSCWSGGAGAGAEDLCQKVRKPYTITKSRESWSEMEHDKFLEALHLFDRDWKKIKAFVGSKSVIQVIECLTHDCIEKIRSHAQKYFMKIQKNGTSEHVPPPRPKRKAAHPYPHKAPKKVASQTSEPLSSAALLDSKYAAKPQSMPVPRNVISSKPAVPLTSMVPTACASPMSRDDCALSGGSMNWSSNSNDSAPHIWDETNSQSKEKLIGKRALPDFAQVYRFMGSLFDPSAGDHLEELKKMDTIDIETVLMLMNNLSVNLVSPELENHRKLISSYGVDLHNDCTGSETTSS